MKSWSDIVVRTHCRTGGVAHWISEFKERTSIEKGFGGWPSRVVSDTNARAVENQITSDRRTTVEELGISHGSVLTIIHEEL